MIDTEKAEMLVWLWRRHNAEFAKSDDEHVQGVGVGLSFAAKDLEWLLEDFRGGPA